MMTTNIAKLPTMLELGLKKSDDAQKPYRIPYPRENLTDDDE
jgi:hypothetical protein